jgi:NAD(P)-dependent dehydrogenase (short-subunit alcohol dehydrogenase family)
MAFAPLLRRSDHARVVNVSSGMGALTGMGGGAPGYRLSKAALNAVTRMLAAELPEAKVNSACPGLVQTDMGGRSAPRTVAEGADTPVWLATLDDDGPTGGFFRDRRPIDF